MVNIFTISYCLAVAVHVSAKVLLDRPFRRDDPLDPSILPSQCNTICTPIYSALNNCNATTTATPAAVCVCTDTIGDNLKSCFGCIVQVNSSAETDGQGVLNSFNNYCSGAGISVTPLSLSVGSSSDTSTTTSLSTTTTSFTTTTTSSSTTTSTTLTPTVTSSFSGIAATTSPGTSEVTSSMSTSTAAATNPLNPTQTSAADKILMKMAVVFVGVFMSAASSVL